ncbi:MAG TPA: hypothetical protein VIE88_11210 [Vicinamibacteria bacterium]|jgi:hypothetical protein
MSPSVPTRVALLKRAPRVYVGPAAERSLRGEAGVLLGARRPDWVDVLEFDPRPDCRCRRLVELRYAAHRRDVVGLSLPASELRRSGAVLLRDLVPGDVVLTERGARVHTGARFVPAKLVGRKRERFR